MVSECLYAVFADIQGSDGSDLFTVKMSNLWVPRRLISLTNYCAMIIRIDWRLARLWTTLTSVSLSFVFSLPALSYSAHFFVAFFIWFFIMYNVIILPPCKLVDNRIWVVLEVPAFICCNFTRIGKSLKMNSKLLNQLLKVCRSYDVCIVYKYWLVPRSTLKNYAPKLC